MLVVVVVTLVIVLEKVRNLVVVEVTEVVFLKTVVIEVWVAVFVAVPPS